ncbi:predicted protein [Histoplasma capsulatum G186AR]|uniref:Uncharacterized protein n=1 Tax=Ajellomyces capsulatus (strain G186AR / H82 / ATCC MYA-2454 / RMSCC 2432) TaxID=447093 RepID=C0NYJ2_AJECG|nr:uncharacterized protein HCBG_07674 [Histoplasma capsulatum G186AR]EEH03548.1 predicted protein [Histoplasma capsulatum G186AR]
MKRGEAHNVHDFATSTKKRKQTCGLSNSVILNTRIRPSISESISAIQRETGMAIGISRREYGPLAHEPSTPSAQRIGRGLTLSTSTVEELAKVSRGEQPSKYPFLHKWLAKLTGRRNSRESKMVDINSHTYNRLAAFLLVGQSMETRSCLDWRTETTRENSFLTDRKLFPRLIFILNLLSQLFLDQVRRPYAPVWTDCVYELAHDVFKLLQVFAVFNVVDGSTRIVTKELDIPLGSKKAGLLNEAGFLALALSPC